MMISQSKILAFLRCCHDSALGKQTFPMKLRTGLLRRLLIFWLLGLGGHLRVA